LGLAIDEYTLKWFKTFISKCLENPDIPSEELRIEKTCNH
jgi:hypothetical protein